MLHRYVLALRLHPGTCCPVHPGSGLYMVFNFKISQCLLQVIIEDNGIHLICQTLFGEAHYKNCTLINSIKLKKEFSINDGANIHIFVFCIIKFLLKSTVFTVCEARIYEYLPPHLSIFRGLWFKNVNELDRALSREVIIHIFAFCPINSNCFSNQLLIRLISKLVRSYS